MAGGVGVGHHGEVDNAVAAHLGEEGVFKCFARPVLPTTGTEVPSVGIYINCIELVVVGQCIDIKVDNAVAPLRVGESNSIVAGNG